MAELASVAIMALAAMGVSFAMLKGNILGWLGSLVEGIPSEYIRKPLGTCNRCAVSVWGTGSLYVLHMLPENLYTLPVLWLCAAGLVDYLDK